MRRCGRVETQRPVAGLQLGSLNLGDASMCGARAMQAYSPSTDLLVQHEANEAGVRQATAVTGGSVLAAERAHERAAPDIG